MNMVVSDLERRRVWMAFDSGKVIMLTIMSWSRGHGSPWAPVVSIQTIRRGKHVDGKRINARCKIIEDLAKEVFEWKRRW